MPVIGNFQLAAGQAAYGGGTSATTAAAVNVALGFVPKYVRVISLNTSVVVTEFIHGDDDVDMGQGVQTKESSGFSAAVLSANGITVGDVVVDGKKVKGFTIGTACQTNSKAFMWIALG